MRKLVVEAAVMTYYTFNRKYFQEKVFRNLELSRYKEVQTVIALEVAEMTFAQKIQEVRKAKGVSVAKLADLAGLPFGTVDGYCIGLRDPSAENLFKIARALEVSCEAFEGCTSSVDEYGKAKKSKKKGK